MNVAVVGALAMAVAVACAALSRQVARRDSMRTIAHPDAAALTDAGWCHGLAIWETMRAGAIVVGLALGAAVGFAPLALATAVAPSLLIRARATERRHRAARETLALLQLSHAALRSGESLPEALRMATSAADEIAARCFVQALREFDLGAPLDRALGNASVRARDRRVALALDALAVCAGEQLPASRCAAVIGSALDRLLFEQRLADDVRARTSGLRLQVLLLAGLVPCLAAYLVITMPGLAQTLGSPLGRFVLVPLAVTFEAAGVIASRRVVNTLA